MATRKERTGNISVLFFKALSQFSLAGMKQNNQDLRTVEISDRESYHHGADADTLPPESSYLPCDGNSEVDD
jgi:hypothetical protein